VGYNAGSVQTLVSWLGGLVPAGGAILELGEQQINGEMTPETLAAVRQLVAKAGSDPAAVETIVATYFLQGPKRIADAFRGSPYTYRCLDVAEGDGVIKADLNDYRVPAEWRGRFDVVTNHGTTEHVGDQINAFRVMHDFAKLGGVFTHHVPFSGYFNHGLYSYTPAFFIFLAHANGYEIEQLDLSAPHLPYTIPVTEAMPGSATWTSLHQHSGLVVVRLRKVLDQDFVPFSDYDAHLVGQRPLSEPWASMIANRYDLRIRDAN